MKKICLAICLLTSILSFSQIQFDSAFVYKQVEKKDIKEADLLYEFFQLSGSNFALDRLSSTDLSALNIAVNRATNMTFAIPKLPDNQVFMRCHSKGVVYGFMLMADKHLMIDAGRKVKLVFENKDDIMFINKIFTTYKK
ncbi:MAG: hypothetical protein V4635_04045 [Bacteroidota bacterium]